MKSILWAKGVGTTAGGAAGLLRVALAALTVVALFFPAVDHHLAERLSWHQHLLPVLAAIDLAHQHAHDREYHHSTRGPLVFVTDATGPVVMPTTAIALATPGESLSGPGHAPVHPPLSHLASPPNALSLPFPHDDGRWPLAQPVALDPPPLVFPS